MTKEKQSEGIRLSYEGMEWAQSLLDTALTKRELRIARAAYEAFWLLYLILTDERKNNQ